MFIDLRGSVEILHNFEVIVKQPPEVFCKKNVFLEISQNSQENACARDSFSIKFEASGPQLY